MWQPVNAKVDAKLRSAPLVTWTHKTRGKGKKVEYVYDTASMTMCEGPVYKDAKYPLKTLPMRFVSTAIVWSAEVQDANHFKALFNGDCAGESLEWYFLDGGGAKDYREERPWKCMRRDEGRVLTDALSNAENTELVPVNAALVD